MIPDPYSLRIRNFKTSIDSKPDSYVKSKCHHDTWHYIDIHLAKDAIELHIELTVTGFFRVPVADS
jgi:hypothetical protein